MPAVDPEFAAAAAVVCGGAGSVVVSLPMTSKLWPAVFVVKATTVVAEPLPRVIGDSTTSVLLKMTYSEFGFGRTVCPKTVIVGAAAAVICGGTGRVEVSLPTTSKLRPAVFVVRTTTVVAEPLPRVIGESTASVLLAITYSEFEFGCTVCPKIVIVGAGGAAGVDASLPTTAKLLPALFVVKAMTALAEPLLRVIEVPASSVCTDTIYAESELGDMVCPNTTVVGAGRSELTPMELVVEATSPTRELLPGAVSDAEAKILLDETGTSST